MKRRYKIAAIDFDGTITYPHEGCRGPIPPPQPICIETLVALKENGWKLVLWTCRAGNRLTEAVNYLKKHELYNLFDAVNSNVEPVKYKTSNKIIATVYIDDRNIGGFPGWEAVRGWLLSQ